MLDSYRLLLGQTQSTLPPTSRCSVLAKLLWLVTSYRPKVLRYKGISKRKCAYAHRLQRSQKSLIPPQIFSVLQKHTPSPFV